MASKENQEILNKIKKELLVNYKTPQTIRIISGMFDILQQAIDDLELYKKAFDLTLEHNKQEDTICLFSGCPNCDYDFEKAICNGKCPTKEELKEFLLEEARTEL